jgi:hypothetical protein
MTAITYSACFPLLWFPQSLAVTKQKWRHELRENHRRDEMFDGALYLDWSRCTTGTQRR